MRLILCVVMLSLLVGCAGASLLGLASSSAMDGLQAGLEDVNRRLAESDGQVTSLSLGDWGGVAGAVLTGMTGLNIFRNKTRAKDLKKV